MCTAQPVSGIFLQVTKQPFTSERNSAPLPPPSGFGKRGLWPWTPLPPNIKPQSDSFSRLTSPEIIPREDARQPKTQQHANLTWRHLTLEDFSTQKNELFWNFSPGYLHIPFVFSNARAAQSISQGAGQASLIWQSQRQMRPREMRRKIAGVLFENMVQLEGDNSALWDLMEFAPLFSSKMQAELDAGTVRDDLEAAEAEATLAAEKDVVSREKPRKRFARIIRHRSGSWKLSAWWLVEQVPSCKIISCSLDA
ncbi:hypothetical protein B2J93_3873 [Marssonina coronariae]|uniref:Uncharacterized protein n=1 Tax=Diplocarpon coronariae TaxID=2795749 RepID=A0A218YVT7_9HELO|nr:hypothetical protein B2J93_3873 [Marssonina coronariae]